MLLQCGSQFRSAGISLGPRQTLQASQKPSGTMLESSKDHDDLRETIDRVLLSQPCKEESTQQTWRFHSPHRPQSHSAPAAEAQVRCPRPVLML